MKVLPRFIFACLLAALAGPALSAKLPLSERVLLQTQMQSFVEQSLVDGKYLHIDPARGKVVALTPMEAHPMIMKMGDYFILCAQFQNTDGDEVNIDFYFARQGDSFVVFDTLVERHDVIERLSKTMTVERVR
ncbi:MAG: hypothetical protein K0U93_24365 [Gammaproteobacteria bacterium]|nr:hypothetical protein [Gammaproteobacteria bacterium]